MRQIAISFALIAVATFAVQIVRLLGDKVIVEFAYLFVLFLCWMAAMFGTRGILKYRPEFAQGYRAAMVAVVCVVCAIGLSLMDWRRGAELQSFISAGVMFMMYTQMMAQLYTYSKILNGGGEICKRARNVKKRNACRIVWKPCVLIILLSLFAVEIAKIFEGQTVYIIAGIAASLALIAHFLMVRMILSVVDIMDGRSTGQRTPRQGAGKQGAAKKSGGAKKTAKRPAGGGTVKVKS